MVSATDIITYIGVPLAVLGVLPIMYVFLSALYARYSVRRKLQENGLLSISTTRARLMNGFVEVGLPIFQLTPYPRSDLRYWGKSNLIAMDGASWRPFPWKLDVLSTAIVQLHSSDKIVLPEAAINFNHLVGFLLDRGARLYPQGVQLLSDHGTQTPVDTILMVVGQEPCYKVMTVARPATHHTTLSVQLHWTHSLQYTGRNEDSILPSLIKIQEFPIEQTNPQRAFEVKMGTKRVDSAVSKFEGYTEADPEADTDMNFIRGEFMDYMNWNGLEHNVWFATAIVAVFGALNGTAQKFKCDAGILFFCEKCPVPLDLVLPIVDINTVVSNQLEDLRNYCDSQHALLPDSWEEKIPQNLQSRAIKLRPKIVTGDELIRVVVVWKLLAENVRNSLPTSQARTHTDCTNRTDMPGLLYFCLWLLQQHTSDIRHRLFPDLDPVQLEPGEAIMTAAERILRIMVFEGSFAKQVLQTLKEVYMSFSEDRYKDIIEREKWVGEQKSRPFETGAALILLISIGLRAGYLVAGENMGKCTARWQSVYIS